MSTRAQLQVRRARRMEIESSVEVQLHGILGELRQLLWDQRMTWDALEDLLGWSRGALRDRLTLRHPLHLEDLYTILEAVHVEPSEFFKRLYMPEARR